MKEKIKFAMIVLISGIIGGFSSIIAQANIEKISNNLNIFSSFMVKNIIFLMLTIFIPLLLSHGFLIKLGKVIKKDIYLRDDIFETVDKKLNYISILTTVPIPFLFMCMAIGCSNLKDLNVSIVVLFVVQIIYYMFLISKIVRFEKILCPEKTGNIFDIGFAKQWYANLDEYEKQTICEASYKSFSIMSRAYPIIFVLIIIFSTVYNISPIFSIFIAVLWILHILSYSISVQKIRYANKKS